MMFIATKEVYHYLLKLTKKLSILSMTGALVNV
jgi:hypothetical protein